MFLIRNKIITHKSGTTRKFVMQGNPIQQRGMCLFWFPIFFVIWNDIFNLSFWYLLHLVKRRRVSMPNFSGMNRNVAGPSRIEAAVPIQQQNSTSTVGFVDNSPVGDLEAHQNASQFELQPIAQRRMCLLCSFAFFFLSCIDIYLIFNNFI